jgi:hypothetical protein
MIQLDQDDIFISCLNISSNQVPGEFLDWLEALEPYTYMDTNDLLEHMYSMDELHEKLEERPIEKAQFDTLLEEITVLMVQYNCAYFRLIKM